MSEEKKCVPLMAAYNQAKANIGQLNEDISKAKGAYLNCLGPEQKGNALLGEAEPAMAKAQAEADTIAYMEKFILTQLERETGTDKTLNSMASIAEEEITTMRSEIDELKTSISTEKRRFIDASPSASTAVAGIYFTGQPDNQVLIAFLCCFFAFLLITGILLITNHIPMDALNRLSFAERLQMVGLSWLLGIILMYVGFFMFT